jgi:hypothetical protein
MSLIPISFITDTGPGAHLSCRRVQAASFRPLSTANYSCEVCVGIHFWYTKTELWYFFYWDYIVYQQIQKA